MSVFNNPAFNTATKGALASVAANQSAPRKETPAEAPLRAFYLAGPGYNTQFTSKGDPFTFYNGFCVTSSPELIEEILKNKEVKEVDYSDRIPTPPARTKTRKQIQSESELVSLTTISPLELMTRTIANSQSLPQAKDSNSGGPQ